MKPFPFLLLIVLLSASCKKTDDSVELQAEFFELSECFSAMSLSGAQIVITDNDSYLEFQDSIRRYFFDYCDTVTLPEIDFSNSFFIGAYSQATGCGAEYKRQVYYNKKSDSYIYEIKVVPFGDCQTLVSSFNCAIVPKQSASAKVAFTVLI